MASGQRRRIHLHGDTRHSMPEATRRLRPRRHGPSTPHTMRSPQPHTCDHSHQSSSPARRRPSVRCGTDRLHSLPHLYPLSSPGLHRHPSGHTHSPPLRPSSRQRTRRGTCGRRCSCARDERRPGTAADQPLRTRPCRRSPRQSNQRQHRPTGPLKGPTRPSGCYGGSDAWRAAWACSMGRHCQLHRRWRRLHRSGVGTSGASVGADGIASHPPIAM